MSFLSKVWDFLTGKSMVEKYGGESISPNQATPTPRPIAPSPVPPPVPGTMPFSFGAGQRGGIPGLSPSTARGMAGFTPEAQQRVFEGVMADPFLGLKLSRGAKDFPAPIDLSKYIVPAKTGTGTITPTYPYPTKTTTAPISPMAVYPVSALPPPTPRQAQSGVPGISGTAPGSNLTPQTGTMGRGGDGFGISARTGLLGAAGLPIGQQGLSEEERNRAGQIVNKPVFTPDLIALTGGLSPDAVIRLAQERIPELNESIQNIRATLNKPGVKIDFESFQNELNNMQTVLADQLKAIKPSPNEPMFDKEGLVDLLPVDPNARQKSLNTLQAYEQQEYENLQRELGIPGLNKNYADELVNLEAGEQTYAMFIKDIQDNPEFPKRLAQRRILEVEKARDINLGAIRARIDLIKTEILAKREELGDRMGITQRSVQREFTAQQQTKQEEERKRDNARNRIDQLRSSLALGDLADEELRVLASEAGYTFGSLQKLASAVASKKTRDITEADRKIKAQEETQARAEARDIRAEEAARRQEEYLRLAYQKAETGGDIPKNYTDEELRVMTREALEQYNQQEIADLINSNPVIQNKDRAMIILNELASKQEDNTNLGFWSRLW